jgi:TatD DNase family protein
MYYDNIPLEIEESISKGVNKFINIGCDINSLKEVIELSKKYKNMYCAIGIHPNEINTANDQHFCLLKKYIKHPKVVAIGEIGLDYHYDKNQSEEQIKWFEKQLHLAEYENMPVIIHSRDATKDTIDILKKYQLKGIIHSFSGSYETAKEYIKMGYLLGINGVITFKNSNLKEVIKKVSLEYIVLETDAPYLTPEPYRGKINHPKHIKEIAEFISDLKGISAKELGEITNKNLRRIFDI